MIKWFKIIKKMLLQEQNLWRNKNKSGNQSVGWVSLMRQCSKDSIPTERTPCEYGVYTDKPH
jgi:hypothetical protein